MSAACDVIEVVNGLADIKNPLYMTHLHWQKTSSIEHCKSTSDMFSCLFDKRKEKAFHSWIRNICDLTIKTMAAGWLAKYYFFAIKDEKNSEKCPTIFFTELCWEKGNDGHTKQWKKEERKRIRGERDQIRFIELRIERWQVVGLSELFWRKVSWWPIQGPNRGRKKKVNG